MLLTDQKMMSRHLRLTEKVQAWTMASLKARQLHQLAALMVK